MSQNPLTPTTLMPVTIGTLHFDWVKSLWLWCMLAIGLTIGITHLTTAAVLVASSLGCLSFCVGHSVGLHRGIIHRCYEAPRWLRCLLAYLFIVTGLGGPLTWARLHAVRDHWQNQEGCPGYFAYRHGLLRDFWWNLHLRFEPSDDRVFKRLPNNIFNDPWLRFLEVTWPLHQLPIAAVIWLWLGPTAVASVICGRVAVGILCHWFIGYASHAWGESPHPIAEASEQGTNHWLLGVISFGEGFHNNHHAFPSSARMGLRRWDVDLGWWVILGFKRLGLIYAIQTAADQTMDCHGRPYIDSPSRIGNL